MANVSLNTTSNTQTTTQEQDSSVQTTQKTSSGSLGGASLKTSSTQSTSETSDTSSSDGVEDPDDSDPVDITAEIASQISSSLYNTLNNLVSQAVSQTRSLESVQSDWNQAKRSDEASADVEFAVDQTTGRQSTQMRQSGETWRDDQQNYEQNLLDSTLNLQPPQPNLNPTSVSGLTGVNSYEG